MSTTTERVLGAFAAALLCAATTAAGGQTSGYGFGTSPAPGELDRFYAVMPDGRGLPPGSGSVEQGKVVYQEQCAACHGANLQGGLADRLIGGRGTLANNDPTKAPVKTIESYWPYATTIFDYVKRAMPFATPGSLSDDQIYAVTAYILSQAKIVPPDAVLNATTLAAVKMPNRDGFIPDPRPERFPPAAKSPHQILAITPSAAK
jgi:mono/diheme cytochrome c family protein